MVIIKLGFRKFVRFSYFLLMGTNDSDDSYVLILTFLQEKASREELN